MAALFVWQTFCNLWGQGLGQLYIATSQYYILICLPTQYSESLSVRWFFSHANHDEEGSLSNHSQTNHSKYGLKHGGDLLIIFAWLWSKMKVLKFSAVCLWCFQVFSTLAEEHFRQSPVLLVQTFIPPISEYFPCNF